MGKIMLLIFWLWWLLNFVPLLAIKRLTVNWYLSYVKRYIHLQNVLAFLWLSYPVNAFIYIERMVNCAFLTWLCALTERQCAIVYINAIYIYKYICINTAQHMYIYSEHAFDHSCLLRTQTQTHTITYTYMAVCICMITFTVTLFEIENPREKAKWHTPGKSNILRRVFLYCISGDNEEHLLAMACGHRNEIRRVEMIEYCSPSGARAFSLGYRVPLCQMDT